MHLPDEMKRMRYVEWNHAVKGLMEVWELARLLGLEESLESQLRSDDGTLALQLGDIGNEFLNAGNVVRRSAVAITLAHSACLLEALGDRPKAAAVELRGHLSYAMA